MILYSYWRSSTACRVRIGLNLKGVEYRTRSVDLVAGELRCDEYRQVNPIGGVPSLQLPNGEFLTQSMAILDYLDRQFRDPPFYPTDPVARAKVQAAALLVATDIHPVNNSKVVNRIKSLGHDADQALEWMLYWMQQGFEAFQNLLPNDAVYCFGDSPGLADICLVPQMYNARHWGLDTSTFARLVSITDRCLDHPAFAAAIPENQPDATS